MNAIAAPLCHDAQPIESSLLDRRRLEIPRDLDVVQEVIHLSNVEHRVPVGLDVAQQPVCIDRRWRRKDGRLREEPVEVTRAVACSTGWIVDPPDHLTALCAEFGADWHPPRLPDRAPLGESIAAVRCSPGSPYVRDVLGNGGEDRRSIESASVNAHDIRDSVSVPPDEIVIGMNRLAVPREAVLLGRRVEASEPLECADLTSGESW